MWRSSRWPQKLSANRFDFRRCASIPPLYVFVNKLAFQTNPSLHTPLAGLGEPSRPTSSLTLAPPSSTATRRAVAPEKMAPRSPAVAALALATMLMQLPAAVLADYVLTQQMADATCSARAPSGTSTAQGSFCVPDAASSTSTGVVWRVPRRRLGVARARPRRKRRPPSHSLLCAPHRPAPQPLVHQLQDEQVLWPDLRRPSDLVRFRPGRLSQWLRSLL
jgi:hypothetical protein